MRPLDFWHIGLILTFPVMAVLMLCAYIYNLTLKEESRLSLAGVIETCWNAPEYL